MVQVERVSVYEFHVWASGEVRDTDGNVIETEQAEEEAEKPEESK